MERVSVDLGSRTYPIHIGTGMLAQPAALGDLLRPHIRGRQAAVVTNPTVGALYTQAVRDSLPELQLDVFEMPDGEAHKNLDSYAAAMDFLMQRRHSRNTCLIALGGGVVGDLAGFIAATYQRGVDFIQIPTTLLAQVDSSVGGKTAINHALGKNMIGAFYQPRCVVIDTAVLNTLAPREYAAGLAEVVKYGVIADASLFAELEQQADALLRKEASNLIPVIRRCCEIKAEVVAADERESGIRAILNFGHTFGHAIENLSGYGVWLHGEAVSIGMVMAAQLSERLHWLPQGGAARIETLLSRLQLPVSLRPSLPAADMIEAMGMDKKAADGQLRFILARDIGEVAVHDQVEMQPLMQVLNQ